MLFDDIYRVIGEFGPYQITVYLLLMGIAIPVGWSHCLVVFIGAWMDHWCQVPGLDHLTAQQQKYLAIPHGPNGGYSHCYHYDLPFANYTQNELETWNRSLIINEDTPIKHCVNWIYDQSVLKSTMMSKWDLVCESEYLVSLSQTIYMLGLLTGSFLFGQLSDAIGRKKTIMIAIVVWIAAGLPASFCPNFYGFVVLRFIIGGAAMGAYAVSFVICMEIIGPSWRMGTGILVQGFFALGIMTLSGVAYVLPQFHNIMLVNSVVPAWCLLHFIFIPESPRWLVSKGRDAEAEAILRQAAKFNNKPVPEHMKLDENRSQDEDIEKATILDLFKTPRLRKLTICMWICWAIVTVQYYGLSLGVGMLKGSLFWNNFLVGAVEIPAFFMSIVALNKIGRRLPLIGTYLGCGVFCLVAIPMLNHPDLETILVIFLMIGKACGATTFAILYVYSAELFPTVARNVGVGTSSMAGRVGGLIQPQIAMMEKWWSPAPFLVYGAVGFVGCLTSLVFPETRNKQLPETLEEAEKFGLTIGDKKDKKDVEMAFIPKDNKDPVLKAV